MDGNVGQVFFWVTVVLWVVGVAALWVGRSQKTDQSETLMTWGDIFVGAAEQLYIGNEEKFAYAYEQLRKKAAAVAPGVSDAEIQAVIEWAVRRLKANAMTKLNWDDLGMPGQ